MVRGIQTGILISSRRRRVVFFSGLQLPERAKGRARRKRSRAKAKKTDCAPVLAPASPAHVLLQRSRDADGAGSSARKKDRARSTIASAPRTSRAFSRFGLDVSSLGTAARPRARVRGSEAARRASGGASFARLVTQRKTNKTSAGGGRSIRRGVDPPRVVSPLAMARTAPVSAVADPEVSASSEVAVALGAALCSGIAVSPFLMCVDRGVVASAAGTAPGGSLFRAIASVAGEFVTKPKAAFGAPALWMVAGVYGGTYFAKNLSDVIIRRGRLEHNPAAGACKFVATTATNAGGSVLKDAAFARMYGAAAAGAVAVVPPASYALVALRDCLTIGGAFFVPELMAGAMKTALPADRVGAADAAAQLVSPPLMQVLCTPMHLLALDLVNQPAANAAARVARLKNSTPAALFARSLRMLPAYGVGGLLNTSLTERGRAAAIARRNARVAGAPGGPVAAMFAAMRGKASALGQAARAKVAAASAPREARDASASASSTTAALNASASASGGDAASADQGRRGRAAASTNVGGAARVAAPRAPPRVPPRFASIGEGSRREDWKRGLARRGAREDSEGRGGSSDGSRGKWETSSSGDIPSPRFERRRVRRRGRGAEAAAEGAAEGADGRRRARRWGKNYWAGGASRANAGGAAG